MDDNDLLRYSRQILLPRVDIEGQLRLLDATALIIGLGGLGSPVATYLAAAGVGHLIINDFDTVDLSNLQRQPLHTTDNLGQPKTESARHALSRLNPNISLTCIGQRLDEAGLEASMLEADVVLDCSDNLTTRFAVNRACFRQGKPLVSGAVIRFEGQLGVFRPGVGDSPCYNCLYQGVDELGETCSQTGVIAPLPGIIGSLQALEAIKLIAMPDTVRTGEVMLFDALSMDWQKLRLPRNPVCPTCGRQD
jgi:adenylyltransferase/sulfurtransferase